MRQVISDFIGFFSLFAALSISVAGQIVVDMTVATVGDGVRVELITLSDLKWQLALQPGTSIDQPRSEDLNQALQTLINQRIFVLEAERLPQNPPTEKEIAAEVEKTLAYFTSPSEFENRLRRVGFTSIRDENFERMIAQRIAIEKYLDFRFRSFIVVTPDDEENYYRTVFVPDFRRRFPGLLMPTLDERRGEINELLREERVAAAIEAFLDDAKRRVEIVILSEL
ncbi:MAG TPA: hypothetical protein PKD24_07975 [Pyrinomonadaceae bacterium]|nr:hypothetical protein [Pyrinomonadaceae bacterium]